MAQDQEFKEKLQSLQFSTRRPVSKKDRIGNVITEHADGRRDVQIMPESVKVVGLPGAVA